MPPTPTPLSITIPRPAPVVDFDPRDHFRLSPEFLASYAGEKPLWGPLGEVTFARTYPRFLEDMGRFETAVEVFARVTEAVMGTLAHRAREVDAHWSAEKAQADGQELFRRMWALKLLPAGRGLANLGTPAVLWKGAAVLYNCCFVSTVCLREDVARPFAELMDYLMLGVGVGFDVRGSDLLVEVLAPEVSEDTHVIDDTREGWVAAVVRVLRAFRGADTLPAGWDFARIRAKGVPLKTFGGVSSGPGPLRELLQTLTGLWHRYIGRRIDEELIVDTSNIIGRCVVAGGVRRSSEIALGPGTDAFLGLKDPTGLNELYARLRAVEDAHPEVAAIDAALSRLREAQALDSVLSEAFAAKQDAIDTLTGNRRAVLSSDPTWRQVDDELNRHPLRSWRWASNNSVLAKVGQNYDSIAERIIRNGEPGILWVDNVRAYGRMCDGDLTRPRIVTPTMVPNLRPDDATGVNPCGEIALEDSELCNLVETFPGRHADAEDWYRTLKFALFIGKATSLLPLHNPRTGEVQARNRRLGISISGIAEWYTRLGAPAMSEVLDAGYRLLRRLDRLYSGWLEVPESIRLTTVKPSGTVSLLAGVEGGMRFPEATHVVRTIRIHDTSDLIPRLEASGYRVEPDRYAPNTVVAYFPLRDTRVGRTAREVTLWEQAQLQALFQGVWADNSVSATLMFRRTEAGDVRRVIAAHDRDLKGLSMLPSDDHGYVQPPYAPITAREYDAMSSRLRALDLDNLRATRDIDERYCDGGVCSLPPAAV